MISGTYVLTDTIKSAFTSIFTQTYQNADAIISGKTAFTNDNGNAVQAPSFPESLLGKVRALPDVNAAEGSVTDDQTKLIGRDGKVDLDARRAEPRVQRQPQRRPALQPAHARRRATGRAARTRS